jgi:hypothetical protein
MTVYLADGSTENLRVGEGVTGRAFERIELHDEDAVPELADYLEYCIKPRIPAQSTDAFQRKVEDFLDRHRLPAPTHYELPALHRRTLAFYHRLQKAQPILLFAAMLGSYATLAVALSLRPKRSGHK